MRALVLALAACAAPAWQLPQGWRGETFAFPIDFAPALPHRGFEVLRFAPGFLELGKPGHWSYAFAWRLDDPAALDAPALAGELTAYFRGVIAAVDDKHRIADVDRARIAIAATPDRGGFALHGLVFDAFGDGGPLELSGTAERRACGGGALWLVTFTPAANPTYRAQLAAVVRDATCQNVRR